MFARQFDPMKHNNIIHIVAFLKKNLEFFSAMFTDTKSIHSLIDYDKGEQSFLLESMENAFRNDKALTFWMSMGMFRIAILGKENENVKGLIDNDNDLIIRYLANNPSMLQALMKNQCDPIIRAWNTKHKISSSVEKIKKAPKENDTDLTPNQEQPKIFKGQHNSKTNCNITTLGFFATSIILITAGVTTGLNWIAQNKLK